MIVAALSGATILGVKAEKLGFRKAATKVTHTVIRIESRRAKEANSRLAIRFFVGVDCVGERLADGSQDGIGIIIPQERRDVAHLLGIDSRDFGLEIVRFNNVALDGLNNHGCNLIYSNSLPQGSLLVNRFFELFFGNLKSHLLQPLTLFF